MGVGQGGGRGKLLNGLKESALLPKLSAILKLLKKAYGLSKCAVYTLVKQVCAQRFVSIAKIKKALLSWLPYPKQISRPGEKAVLYPDPGKVCML